MANEGPDLVKTRDEADEWFERFIAPGDIGSPNKAKGALVALVLRARADGIEAARTIGRGGLARISNAARLRALADREESR